MIKEKIDELYNSTKKNRQWDGIHASAIAKCQRELYFDAKIGNKEFEPRVKRILENGDYFHQRMMRTFYRLSDIKIISSEISMPVNDLIKGTCDAIISLDNENYVVDFKSINGFGFDSLEKAKQEHIQQITIYMHFFKINKAIIIYECKDNQELKEFLVRYDKIVMNEILKKAEYIKECIEKNIVPPKPVFDDDNKWRCRYCKYQNECKKIN